MDEREQVFERWDVRPLRYWWKEHQSVQEVIWSLQSWQEDFPGWNTDANIQEDAEVIWDWITEEEE